MTINYRRSLLQGNDSPHQQRINGNQETPPITYGRYRLASCRTGICADFSRGLPTHRYARTASARFRDMNPTIGNPMNLFAQSYIVVLVWASICYSVSNSSNRRASANARSARAEAP